MSPKKSKPEISIEWMDVTIDIKVCGVDVPAEDRGFVRLFPELDSKLVSRDQIDANRMLYRKERKKLQKFEYKLVTPLSTTEALPKVLPKLTCNHCGKSFSRRSTLDQHIASHDLNNSSWEDVQDAALQDLEQAIVFGNPVGGGEDHDVSREEEEEEEEEEIPAPDSDQEHRCPTCSKVFNKNSLLRKHMKLHTGIKPYSCTVCGWKFLQKYSLKKHMWSHSIEKPNSCVDCLATFSDTAALKDHVQKYHDQEELEFLDQDLTSSTPQLIPCPKCDRKFAAKAHLDRHMPVHNNMAKPYECDICGWKFHLLHNMERHKSTHQKGKKAKVPPHKRMRRKMKKKKKDAKKKKESEKEKEEPTEIKTSEKTKTKTQTIKIKEFSNDFSDDDEVAGNPSGGEDEKEEETSDDEPLPEMPESPVDGSAARGETSPEVPMEVLEKVESSSEQ